MEVRSWRSFSANNSGSFYLVGRFASAEEAERSATELRAFLFELSAELDLMESDARYSRQTLTPAGQSFAGDRGIDWQGRLVLGEAEDEELDVHNVGDQVLIYHDYCLGFDKGLEDYIEAGGGVVEAKSQGWLRRPVISLLAELPDPSLAQKLRERLRREGEAEIAFYDGHFAGHVATLEPARIEELQAWLGDCGVRLLEMSLDRHKYAHRFAAMGEQECHACGSRQLRYLPAFAFDSDDDQVACQNCGGMFAAAGFFAGEVAHLSLLSPDGGPGGSACFDPLVKERFLIGRARQADLPIMSDTISRHHCAIEFDDGQYFVHDLGGENGMALNAVGLGVRERYPLADGDDIGLPFDYLLRVKLVPRG